MTTRDRTAWLQGGNALCVQAPPDVGRTWRLVLLGPPGGGKGTQANLLQHSLGACPLSTGDVFRAARHGPRRAGSPIVTIQEHMARGELVPDKLVLDMIRDRSRCLHCRGGFMLDGFPRTLAQARALDALLQAERLALDAVLYYEVSADELSARLMGRRVCPRCQAVFHLENRRPRIEGLCDQCGSALVQRDDDQPAAIATRLAAYTGATLPLLDHYARQDLLVTVRAEGSPSEILAHTLDLLVARQPSAETKPARQ